MPLITLHLNKSVEQNASLYYEKAKKLRKKKEGAIKALEETKSRLKKLEAELSKELEKEANKVVSAPRAKEWYEKFRWFFSSSGLLVIGGRDATTNEIIIKKHLEKDDIVFHTDISGSPFFVIKTKGEFPDKEAIIEAADATASFSRAWKLGLSGTPVFWVKPEQLSKTAKSGEYLTKGAFVISGKANYVENNVNLAIGVYEEKIMAAPLSSARKNCKAFIEIEQGREKASDVAKRIRHKIGGSIDDIIRALPSGGCRVKK